jgi:PST family polysaccharide transporter
VPLRYLLNVSDEILLPGLAVLQTDRGRARDYYLMTLRIELAILGPVVVVAAVFAPDFSDLLFGPSWARAAIIAQFLAFAGWRHITGHTTGAVLLSHGRPDLQLRWTAYSLLLSIVYFFAGSPWGLVGVVVAQAVLETISWAIRHTMANRILELSWRQFARSLAPLWCAHAALVVLAMLIRRFSIMIDPSAAVHLVMALPLIAVAYLILLRIAIPGLLTTLRRGTVQSVAHGVAVQDLL